MNPMRAIKLIVMEWMVDGGRRRLSAGRAAQRAILVLGLASGFLVAAQEPEPDAPPQPNEVMAAEILSQLGDLVQPEDTTPPEDMTPPEDLTPNNGSSPATRPAPGGDRPNKSGRPDASTRPENSSRFQAPSRFQTPGRSQKDDRRSRGRRPSGSSGSAYDYGRGSDGSLTSSLAGTNNIVTLDYASFKIIVDRNIFNPNRYPRQGPPPVRQETPARSVDYLTLVGTMSYEQGTFAFFDGTSSQYKKALKLADAIAGYKVTNIAPNGVKLASGTNVLELSVGAQLRREESGPWRLASQSRSYTATPASTSTNAAASTNSLGSVTASGGADSDILKRLMEKREKE
jgi:hypothetical protein